MDWKRFDWKRLDRARRDSSGIELDLIESYAQGKVNRRDFIRRGTILGLSIPVMSAVVAACGGSSDGGSGNASSGSAGGTTGAAATGSATAGSGGGGSGGSLIIAVQQGDANSGLDPVNMLDLGTYDLVSQSFEYLVGLGDDGNIAATALAESWEPNETGDVWTFVLRDGPVWSDGSPVTSADVAATMDRLAKQGNAGLAGVIDEGSVDSSDPKKAVFTLVEPNGNFPVLVSLFNAQALITPVDYTDGTTLSERPEGSGAWKLDNFDASTFVAKFVPNPNWWGGSVNLDSIELRGFAELGTAITAMQSRDIDVIQQFTVLAGSSLLDDENFTVLTPPASTHRQMWFNVQQGQFGDPRVRQAFAWAVDREQMVSTLFRGRAEVANDAPIVSTLPFFDPEAVPQRTRDVEKAKALLAEAGVGEITTSIATGDILEIPQLAAITQANLAEAGITATVQTQSNSTFYGDAWCPGPSETDDTLPCDNAAEFGIVDYGHRPTPDVFLSSALATGGVWNSSNYANSDFDAKLSEYRRAVDVDGQKTAIGAIQKILWDEVPAVYPYFYNYLSGHDNSVSGVQATALGHTIVSKATKSG